MREISEKRLLIWPQAEVQENFKFECNDSAGIFVFEFKWFDDQWHCWATTPEGDTRPVGIYPGAISWTGFLDYGIDVETSLAKIDFSSLFDKVEMYIIKWK